MSLLNFGFFYFITVFSAGFILGIFRILLLVPQLGERISELLELPLMAAISFFVARWILRKKSSRTSKLQAFFIGIVALGFLLMAELGVLFFVRHQSLSEYIEGRDPISGTVYLMTLLLYALMPLLIRVKSNVTFSKISS